MTPATTKTKTEAELRDELAALTAEQDQREARQHGYNRDRVAPDELATRNREKAENDQRLADLPHHIAHVRGELAEAEHAEQAARVRAWIARSAEITTDASPPLSKKAGALARDLAAVLSQLDTLAEEDDGISRGLAGAGRPDAMNSQGGSRAGMTPINRTLQDLITLYDENGTQLWPRR